MNVVARFTPPHRARQVVIGAFDGRVSLVVRGGRHGWNFPICYGQDVDGRWEWAWDFDEPRYVRDVMDEACEAPSRIRDFRMWRRRRDAEGRIVRKGGGR